MTGKRQAKKNRKKRKKTYWTEHVVTYRDENGQLATKTISKTKRKSPPPDLRVTKGGNIRFTKHGKNLRRQLKKNPVF